MRKLRFKRAVVFSAVFIFITAQTFVKVSANTESAQFNVHEFSGKDRYETCSLIAQQGWSGGCKNIVIASGENFPDALSSIPLAVQYNAPILLTRKDSLSDFVSSEIDRLNPQNAFIIGGTGVISDKVEQTIKDKGIITDRIWGNNRYETSIKIAQRIGNSGKIFVVAGNDYPDALSVASIAAKEGNPVILSDKDAISPEIRNYINDYHVTGSYLLGGPAVIKDRVYDALPDCTRIYGQNRYLTNIKVINKFMDELNLDNVFIANGDNFPDALSLAPLAGLNSAPVILSRVNQEKTTGNFFASINSFVKDVYIAGGKAVVPRNNVIRTSTGPNAINTLNIPTYDGSNQSCHPKVLYFEKGWNGWKYWMVMTPYPNTNDAYENASILVSNSGSDWQVPKGLKNPLTPLPKNSKGYREHGSDPELVYNQKDDKLELWYRYTYETNFTPDGTHDSTDNIFRITSHNGIDWSQPEDMIKWGLNKGCLSPAIIIENGIYKMWYVAYVDYNYECMYIQSTDGGVTWSDPIKTTLNPPDTYAPWHIDVVHTDKGYEIVYCAEPKNDTMEGKNGKILFYNVSDDGINFGQSKVILRASGSNSAWDNKQIYRSTFVKVNGIYRLYYSAMDKKARWHIGLSQGYSLDDLHGYEGDLL